MLSDPGKRAWTSCVGTVWHATGQDGRASCRLWLWHRGDTNLQVSCVWPQEFPQVCDSQW